MGHYQQARLHPVVLVLSGLWMIGVPVWLVVQDIARSLPHVLANEMLRAMAIGATYFLFRAFLWYVFVCWIDRHGMRFFWGNWAFPIVWATSSALFWLYAEVFGLTEGILRARSGFFHGLFPFFWLYPLRHALGMFPGLRVWLKPLPVLRRPSDQWLYLWMRLWIVDFCLGFGLEWVYDLARLYDTSGVPEWMNGGALWVVAFAISQMLMGIYALIFVWSAWLWVARALLERMVRWRKP